MDTQPIETFTDDHVLQLHALFQKEWWTAGRTLGQTKQVVVDSDVVVGFADRRDGSLIAFARVLTDFVFHGLIFDVIVAERHRGEGWGRRIMDAICSHRRLQSVPVFWLCCLPEMMPFYRRWGFTEDIGELKWMRLVRNEETGDEN